VNSAPLPRLPIIRGGSNMHFDPRDYDSRDDPKSPETDRRDRDDDARDIGRGPVDSRDSNDDSRHSREDERWPEREAELRPA
jgi:hypothetical protein